MFSGIGHVMVRVSSFEKALAFYRDTLGLKEAFRLYNDAGALWIIYLHVAGASFIELSESPPGTDGPSSRGFAHLCLTVDDIARAFERLQPTGCILSSAPQLGRDGSWQFWLADPDGNRIEIMQNPPDSQQARAIAARAGQHGT